MAYVRARAYLRHSLIVSVFAPSPLYLRAPKVTTSFSFWVVSKPEPGHTRPSHDKALAVPPVWRQFLSYHTTYLRLGRNGPFAIDRISLVPLSFERTVARERRRFLSTGVIILTRTLRQSLRLSHFDGICAAYHREQRYEIE